MYKIILTISVLTSLLNATTLFNSNTPIKYIGDTIYVTMQPEDNCGKQGEYKYDSNSKQYQLQNFDYKANLKILQNCEYFATPFNNTQVNSKNFKKFDNAENLKLIFAENIKNSQSLDDLLNETIINHIKEKELKLDKPQYIGYINLNTQTFYIYYFNENQEFNFIGKSLISSGNKNRGKKFFETPEVLVDRSLYINGDWYAEGTESKGFGNQGEKIFWLGIHNDIHLAMHTTTPYGVENLGKKFSKGCIRVSPMFNKILRETSIFDVKLGKFILIDKFELN